MAAVTLYIVSTPIGNLEDVTLRALRVLAQVALIAAEDTRTTRRLLARHGISTPLVSFQEHNKHVRLPYLLERLQTEDVALVSEAGTPGISDPGYDLVSGAAQAGIQVSPLPGPSAITAALAVSGLPSAQFVYLGFLPRRAPERRRLLAGVAEQPRTLVCFEAPHRLVASLADIHACLGDRPIAVCRELTKLHEEVFRGTVSEARARFTAPRGEFTLVIAGASESASAPDEEQALAELSALRSQGLSARDAVSRVAAETGLPKRALYRAWHRL